MFDRFTRVATAAVGALVLSTVTIAAAAVPQRTSVQLETAAVTSGTPANA